MSPKHYLTRKSGSPDLTLSSPDVPETGLYPEVRMSGFDTDITISLEFSDVLRLMGYAKTRASGLRTARPPGPEADPNNMNKAPSMGLLVPWISGGGQPSYRIPTYRIRGLKWPSQGHF